MNAHHRFILAALRRTRNLWLGIAGFLLVFGVPMAILPHVSDEAIGVRYAASTLGLLTVATGVYAGVLAWRVREPLRAPLMRLLLGRPRDIVWVYVERLDSQLSGITLSKTHSVKICTIGKVVLTLHVSAFQLDPVMYALRESVPHATFGFDGETQRRYKADPTSLVGATL